MSKYSSKEIQKRAERNQIDLFKSLFQSDGEIDIKLIENDPPDAEVFIEGKRIAIELTELTWDKDADGINKKAHESTGEMIMDMARIEYEKLSLPPIYVSVSFNDNYGLIKNGQNLQLYVSDKKRLSTYIVDKVVRFLPNQNNEIVNVPQYNGNWERILDEKISSIHISRLEVLTENCWTTGGGGSVPRLTYEKLKERIESKESKLKHYQRSFESSWLVLIEDWGGISSYFDFINIEEIQDHGIESKFDRIFILRSKKNELIELNLAK